MGNKKYSKSEKKELEKYIKEYKVKTDKDYKNTCLECRHSCIDKNKSRCYCTCNQSKYNCEYIPEKICDCFKRELPNKFTIKCNDFERKRMKKNIIAKKRYIEKRVVIKLKMRITKELKKEEIKKMKKKSYEKNREKILQQKKEYYFKNKDEILRKQKERRQLKKGGK